MTKTLAAGAILLYLAAFMIGCASNPPAVIIPPCSPPMVYLQEVPEPKLEGNTNGDLAKYILALKEALKQSNLDKYHLLLWSAGGQ